MRSSIRPLSRLLLVLCVLAQGGMAGLSSAGAQGETVDAPPQVNLEIILDSSGSMANLTDTGETRMDAAKRVLTEVINSIPQRAGQINVGFRLYGHRGDNTDATKDVSCKASDLLVPVNGVDQPALIGAVNSAQPTGWTPISRSLSRAGKDFPEAGDGVINTVLLVTDGLETCDGDPVKVAGDLRKKPSVQMTTHVVGFGTTPEEQTVLQGIADAGGGQLFGASNAQQLRAALFDVLTQLKIVVGVGYVGGNAFGVLPPGNAGEFSVVGYFRDSFMGMLSFALRNNTGVDAAGLKVTVTVRDGAGNLVAAGDALTIAPFFVRAGGYAFGNIWLGTETELPADAQFEWKVTPSTGADLRFENTSDLDIVEAAVFENRIIGTVKNGFDEAVQGPFRFTAACFADDGTMGGTADGYLDLPQLAPGEEQSFQVDLDVLLYGGGVCPAFLVAGSGNGPVQLPVTTSSSTGAVAPAPQVTGQGEATFSLPGLMDAALRNYQAPLGATEGILGFATVSFIFTDGPTASTAFESILTRYFTAHDLDPAIAQAVDAPTFGTQRKAVVFSLDGGIDAAIVMARNGEVVYFFMVQAIGVDPIAVIAGVESKLFANSRKTDPANGALGLLPTLIEMPARLELTLEKVPEDWGPVPAQ